MPRVLDVSPSPFLLESSPAIDASRRRARIAAERRDARRAGATRVFDVLNLGCGVQSTSVYLMDALVHHQGRRREVESWLGEPYRLPRLQAAVFADTQDEPAAVYRHLEWLRTVRGAIILEGTAGRLGDDLVNGVNSTGQRFASIPAFTSPAEGVAGGITRRQCTAEYKIEVCERIIRRHVLGLPPGVAPPRDVLVRQWFGLSYDEPARIVKVDRSIRTKGWAEPTFPLYDLVLERSDCVAFLASIGVEAPRSACVFCPYRRNREWRHLRDTDPDGWSRAVAVDEGMRRADALCARSLDHRLYVHRSCLPLAVAPIDDDDAPLPFEECEGVCLT